MPLTQTAPPRAPRSPRSTSRFSSSRLRPALAALAVLVASCGGGGGSSSSSVAAASPSAAEPPAASSASAATRLAARLGKPARLLLGLGTGNSEASVQAQGLQPDLYDAYLSSGWQDWNSPTGSYVNLHADRAQRLGAVPMFTLYQMANNGDGNLAVLTDDAFMRGYWANVRLAFQRMALTGRPALVTVEPDFWGYVQLQAPGGDPRRMPARVTIDADCAGQPDDVSGVAGCILQLARKYAPNAAVGFMPSAWGGRTAAEVAAFMQQVGAQRADFVAVETLDRDAGCFEAAASGCSRAGAGWYWDDAAFAAHLALARTFHEVLGLPLVWWQTPMGVPAATPGGSDGHWRDNRMQYFLTHAPDLVAAGGLGVVFSVGAIGQTTIDTDGGQYRRLSQAYLANPATLP